MLARAYCEIYALPEQVELGGVAGLAQDLVPWVRSLGYEILDDPPCSYSKCTGVDRGAWLPR